MTHMPTTLEKFVAKIFLMEDSPPLRRILVRQIRDAGHTVAAFENGEQSRNRGIVGDADVLITDLSMPGVDGEAAIRNVSRLRPNLPIIVISGAVPNYISDLKSVDAVLHKPFSEEKLVETIDTVLQGRNRGVSKKESHEKTRYCEKASSAATASRPSWVSSMVRHLTGKGRRRQGSTRHHNELCSLDHAPVVRSR